MKKTIIATLVTLSSFTHADVLLGGDAEINYWGNKSVVDSMEEKGDSALSGSLSFEHMVPLVPNVRFAFGAADAESFTYGKNDLTLYYEIFDNDLVSFDIGVGATQIHSGEMDIYTTDGGTTVEFEGTIPHAYVGFEVGIPSTPLTIYSDVIGTSYEDSRLIDGSIGVRYDISLVAFEFGVQAGYKMIEFDTEDFDSASYNIKTDGWFVGINLDF
jgi:outer membrane protein